MIQFHSVIKGYGGDVLLDSVNFIIGKGEKCGLVGRNGSGKSTIMRLIVKEESEDSGTISMPKNYRLGYLGQYVSFSQETIVQEAALGLPKEQQDHTYIAETILSGLGFSEEEMENHPSTLSGGYHLRLHLAKVLVSDPDCLLLDEPTNYLDIVSIRWLQEFLISWRKEFLLITHDRAFMDAVTTHTLGIQRQQVRKIGGKTEDFFAQILQEEEVYEKTRLNLEKKRHHMEDYIRRFGAKASKATQAQSRAKAIERLPTLEQLAQIHDLDFTFTEASFAGKQMIEAENLTFHYTPEKPIIHECSLAIEKGEIIAIIGKNGRGKSTLLKLLAEELTPLQGQIHASFNLAIGYFGQTNIDRLNLHLTIEEEIARANPSLKYSEVRRVCGIMMFSGDRAKKRISVLSGGERSRVLLGKIIATPCNLLFLDEPTHHLDMESVEALIWAIKEFQGAVVIVTHSEDILQQIPLTKIVHCTRLGQKITLGDYTDFILAGGWEEEKTSKKKTKKPKENEKPSVLEKKQQIKPLHTEIKRLEHLIIQLEGELKEIDKQLLAAIESGNGKEISALSVKRSEIQEAVEKNFENLDLKTKQVQVFEE